MGFMIQRSGNVDVKQKSLDVFDTVKKTVVADTTLDVLAEDLTATLGRKVVVTNLLTADLFLAYGRTATATDYDIPVTPGSTWVEDNYNTELISGISTDAGTDKVIVTFAKYVEV